MNQLRCARDRLASMAAAYHCLARSAGVAVRHDTRVARQLMLSMMSHARAGCMACAARECSVRSLRHTEPPELLGASLVIYLA